MNRPHAVGPAIGAVDSALIWMRLTRTLLASMFADGIPVRANDFSQSCEEGPRMLPSKNASPGHRVQLPPCTHEEQVVKCLNRIERTSFIAPE